MLTICNRPFILPLVAALLFSITICGDTLFFRAEAAEATPQAASWRVLEAAGSVRYRLPGGASWLQAEAGDVLPPGSRIITDEAANLTVERSGETIIMRPRARLMLPPGYRTHSARQEAGGLSYQIERSPDRRFEVETPYASLVVKGTAFDVDVTAAGVEVGVDDGRVEVTSRDGAAAELGAGHAARVTAADQALEVRWGPDEPYVLVEPTTSTWFDRFLEALQSASRDASSRDDGSTGGTILGGARIGEVSIGGDGVSLGSTSVGGASVGGASVDSGGASVGGVGVGGVSIGGGGASVGGIGIGDRD